MTFRRSTVAAATFAALGALSACRRTAPKPSPAAAKSAPSPGLTCDAVGRMNLAALAAIPELGALTSSWLQQSSPELAAAFRKEEVNPLDGMERARICQTARRGPTGGREVAVTMTGNGAPALFARLTATPIGKAARRQQLAGADVLVGERTWVALRASDSRLVMATTEDVLGQALASTDADARGGGASDEALLSLTFTGQILQDVLSGGRAFRLVELNAVQSLRVDFAPDGTGLTARLTTGDGAAANKLAASLQAFLDAIKASAKTAGGDQPELEARVEGTDVVARAHFGREVLGQFAQALALRSAKPTTTRLR